ncbi:Zinc Finger Cchc Domain-Containing Protein 3 [Manis pentadactyla]|nr:Zinc Finger Cchc Domain-Containing Protein 3 [Manis pentadactyla]
MPLGLPSEAAACPYVIWVWPCDHGMHPVEGTTQVSSSGNQKSRAASPGCFFAGLRLGWAWLTGQLYICSMESGRYKGVLPNHPALLLGPRASLCGSCVQAVGRSPAEALREQSQEVQL